MKHWLSCVWKYVLAVLTAISQVNVCNQLPSDFSSPFVSKLVSNIIYKAP